MKRRKPVLIILLMLLALMGCQPTSLATPAETTAPTSIAETYTPVPTWTPTATVAPATPLPTRAPTETPRPTATATPIPVCAPVWQRALSKSNTLHDLILFTSTVHAPFAHKGIRQQIASPHLWALAADGRQSERLSSSEDVLLIRSATEADVTVDLLVTQPYSIETELVRQHALLPECERVTKSPCSQFQFSPTGTWVAYFWGKEVCGRGIAALDLRTDETRIITATGGHSFAFLSDETMLIGSGHCEGGNLAILDLTTDEQTTLGEAGPIQWNAQRAAFAVNVHPYTGWGSYVWGYNIALGRYFMSPPAERDTEAYQSLWTPADDHLLYQQRTISYTTPAMTALTLSQQQIAIVDAATGERRVLLSDPAYDYHLCTAYEVCPWEGDFIEVRRIPYRPQVFDLEPDFDSAAVNCVAYGFRCADPVERFALNWRTGELVPWDARPAAAVTPTVTPTATPIALASEPVAPNLNRPAFYTAPDGTYTLNLGQDERSLWCVPTGGEPVLWVNNGVHFTYVP